MSDDPPKMPPHIVECIKKIKAWMAGSGMRVSDANDRFTEAVLEEGEKLREQLAECERKAERYRLETLRNDALRSELDAANEAISVYEDDTHARWEADKCTVQRWQTAHPEHQLVWPRRDETTEWLLLQLYSQHLPKTDL